MNKSFEWKIETNGGFIARLDMVCGESRTPVLIVLKNDSCFTSIPTAYVDTFIKPVDISFDEIDKYIEEYFGNIASDELEELRLEYAQKKYVDDFVNQLKEIAEYSI